MGGSGWSSSRYSMMGRDSTRYVPSSSSSTGSLPKGLRAMCSALLCSPFGRFTNTSVSSISVPAAAFSAR